MGDKYTQYSDKVREQIENVDKFMANDAKGRQFFNSLSPEDKVLWGKASPEDRWKWVQEGVKPTISAEPLNPEPPPASPEPQPEPEADTVESLKAKLEKLEQQYRTLQGMSKDTGELERQNHGLFQQIKTLQDELYALQQAKPPEVKKEKVPIREALKSHYDSLAEDLAPEILEKEIKKDERFFELLEERAKQNVSEVVVQFDSKLKLNAEEQFKKDLNDAHPNWKQMWPTPEFQAFLDEEADISGVTRYEIIDRAFKRADSGTVIKAFNRFTGKGTRKGAEEHPPIVNPNKVKNRVAAPPGSPSPLPSNKNNNNQMSPQEARQALVALTSNYTRGLFRGSKEEYDKEYKRLHALAVRTPGTG